MQSNQSYNWPWPKELDALIAAPQHHTLLYENDTVRVLETIIPPGEITAVHTHEWPATLYVLSRSEFIRYDDKGLVTLDSRTLKKSASPSSVQWVEPLPPHALKNIGEDKIHVISIEIKK